MRVAVCRLRIDVQQLGDFKHYRFAAGGAAVDFLTLGPDRFRVGATAGVAALAALALRKQGIYFFHHRVIFYRKAAGGVPQN